MTEYFGIVEKLEQVPKERIKSDLEMVKLFAFLREVFEKEV